jgi:hypothetical protein
LTAAIDAEKAPPPTRTTTSRGEHETSGVAAPESSCCRGQGGIRRHVEVSCRRVSLADAMKNLSAPPPPGLILLAYSALEIHALAFGARQRAYTIAHTWDSVLMNTSSADVAGAFCLQHYG